MLPITIVSQAGLRGHSPPFKSSGGNFYVVIVTTLTSIDVYKATDPTDSWTQQDPTNNPTSIPDYVVLAATQSGDVLSIVSGEATGTKSFDYHEFSMSADTWSVIEEEIESLTNSPAQTWVSIAVRSDGDVIVCYNGQTDANMGDTKERVDLNIRAAGGTSWAGPVALDAAGDIHYGNPNVVISPLTDEMHFIWGQTDSTTDDPPIGWLQSQGRTLDPSDDSLSTTSAIASSTTATLLGNSNSVSYDDGSTQHIIVTGVNEPATQLHSVLWEEDGGDDITISTPNTGTPRQSRPLRPCFGFANSCYVGSVSERLLINNSRRVVSKYVPEVRPVCAVCHLVPDIFHVKVTQDFFRCRCDRRFTLCLFGNRHAVKYVIRIKIKGVLGRGVSISLYLNRCIQPDFRGRNIGNINTDTSRLHFRGGQNHGITSTLICGPVRSISLNALIFANLHVCNHWNSVYPEIYTVHFKQSEFDRCLDTVLSEKWSLH